MPQAKDIVIYHLPYTGSMGADRWIADAWAKGFEYHGYDFRYQSGWEVDSEEIVRSGAILFISDICALRADQAYPAIQRIRSAGVKVALWMHWPLTHEVDPSWRSLVREKNFVDAWFGEREPDGMADFQSVARARYLHMPQAASHLDHYPVAPDPVYAFDIAFVGAKLPMKRWFNDMLIKHLMPRYKVGIFGPGWTMQDNIKRVAAGLLKRAKLFTLACEIDRTRISLPLADEKALYSSATICINAHERDPDMKISHSIVNQRTFKICASGGFQIIDDVPGIRRHFTEDEVVIVPPSPDEWLRRIDYFLNHESEREAIRRRGVQRAHAQHYSHHRVATLMRELGIVLQSRPEARCSP